MVMETHRLQFQPKGTILLRCEVPLRYDCKRPPKKGTVAIKLDGWPVFGLIVTHEYVIEDPRIERVASCDASLPECNIAKGYKVALHYWLSHKLKVTIPLLGLGKGEKEWVSRSRKGRALLRAEGVCCDPNYRPEPAEEREVSYLHGVSAAGLAAGAAAPGGAIAFVHAASWWEIALALVASAVASCLVIVALRLAWPALTDRRES